MLLQLWLSLLLLLAAFCIVENPSASVKSDPVLVPPGPNRCAGAVDRLVAHDSALMRRHVSRMLKLLRLDGDRPPAERATFVLRVRLNETHVLRLRQFLAGTKTPVAEVHAILEEVLAESDLESPLTKGPPRRIGTLTSVKLLILLLYGRLMLRLVWNLIVGYSWGKLYVLTWIGMLLLLVCFFWSLDHLYGLPQVGRHIRLILRASSEPGDRSWTDGLLDYVRGLTSFTRIYKSHKVRVIRVVTLTRTVSRELNAKLHVDPSTEVSPGMALAETLKKLLLLLHPVEWLGSGLNHFCSLLGPGPSRLVLTADLPTLWLVSLVVIRLVLILAMLVITNRYCTSSSHWSSKMPPHVSATPMEEPVYNFSPPWGWLNLLQLQPHRWAEVVAALLVQPLGETARRRATVWRSGRDLVSWPAWTGRGLVSWLTWIGRGLARFLKVGAAVARDVAAGAAAAAVLARRSAPVLAVAEAGAALDLLPVTEVPQPAPQSPPKAAAQSEAPSDSDARKAITAGAASLERLSSSASGDGDRGVPDVGNVTTSSGRDPSAAGDDGQPRIADLSGGVTPERTNAANEDITQPVLNGDDSPMTPVRSDQVGSSGAGLPRDDRQTSEVEKMEPYDEGGRLRSPAEATVGDLGQQANSWKKDMTEPKFPIGKLAEVEAGHASMSVHKMISIMIELLDVSISLCKNGRDGETRGARRSLDSHQQQELDSRLRALRLLLKNGRLLLATDESSKISSFALPEMMAAEPSLDRSEAREMFKQGIPCLDPATLTEDGFKRFEKYFNAVNRAATELVPRRRTFLKKEEELIGLDCLWKVLMSASNDVARMAAHLLLKTFTQLMSKLPSLMQKGVHTDFISSCMDRLRVSHDSLTEQDWEQDGPARQNATTALRRVLTVLRDYIVRCEVDYSEQRLFCPLYRASRGRHLNLVIRLATRRSSCDFTVESHTNQTLAALRRHVLQKVKVNTLVLGVELEVNGETLDHASNKKCIGDISTIRDGTVLAAKLVSAEGKDPDDAGPDDESVLSYDSSDSCSDSHSDSCFDSSSNSNVSSSALFSQHSPAEPNATTESCLPGVIMSQQEIYVDFLLHLADLACQIGDSDLRDTVRSLLDVAPASVSTVEQLYSACQESGGQWPQGTSCTLEGFFSGTPSEVLYSLKVLYSLLLPTGSPLPYSCAQLHSQFLRSGGGSMVLGMLDSEFLSAADYTTRRRALVFVLQITRLVFSTLVMATPRLTSDWTLQQTVVPARTEGLLRQVVAVVVEKAADTVRTLQPEPGHVQFVAQLVWAASHGQLPTAGQLPDQLRRLLAAGAGTDDGKHSKQLDTDLYRLGLETLPLLLGLHPDLLDTITGEEYFQSIVNLAILSKDRGGSTQPLQPTCSDEAAASSDTWRQSAETLTDVEKQYLIGCCIQEYDVIGSRQVGSATLLQKRKAWLDICSKCSHRFGRALDVSTAKGVWQCFVDQPTDVLKSSLNLSSGKDTV